MAVAFKVHSAPPGLRKDSSIFSTQQMGGRELAEIFLCQIDTYKI